MAKIRRIAAAILAGGLLSIGSGPAMAFDTETSGGNGGGAFAFACGPGGYLVSINGSSGKATDDLDFGCLPNNKSDSRPKSSGFYFAGCAGARAERVLGICWSVADGNGEFGRGPHPHPGAANGKAYSVWNDARRKYLGYQGETIMTDLKKAPAGNKPKPSSDDEANEIIQRDPADLKKKQEDLDKVANQRSVDNRRTE